MNTTINDQPLSFIDLDTKQRLQVVFRGDDKKACTLDASCPHLGANLGVGGVVKDNCVVCPFHG